MGQQVECRVTLHTSEGERTADGKALLETSELLFRGDFRLRIPFADISELSISDAAIEVVWPGGTAAFELGSNAPRWADKIRSPRGLLDKLGITPKSRVAVIGIKDADFLDQTRARAAELTLAAGPDQDLVFVAADDIDDLARLAMLRDSIRESGALWVVSPKGRGSKVRDVDVIEAAKNARLVDVKVVSFSASHTALKLVVPLALRKARRPDG